MGENKRLNKENIQDIIGLTPLQEGMLFHYISEPGSRQYFVQLRLHISGNIDEQLIEKAWNHVISQNEILRAVYKWDKLENAVQIILKEAPVKIRKHGLTLQPIESQWKSVNEILDKDLQEGINISEEPFRITLIKLSETCCEMIISNHHIMYDGWSNGILLKEFIEAYNNLYGNQPISKSQKTSFKEYIRWHQSRDQESSKEYWNNYLEDFENTSIIPAVSKIRENEAEINRFSFDMPKDLNNSMEEFCMENKLSKSTLLFGIWGVLLQKYCNTDDVIFGTTVSGRNAKVKEIENIVGLFINTVPLRVKRSEETTAIELLKNLEAALRMRADYENTPIVEVKTYSEIDSRDELIDSIVVIENYPFDKKLKETQGVIKIDSYSMYDFTNYKLTLSIEDFENLKINFSYRNDIYSKDFIERMAGHFRHITIKILNKKNLNIEKLQIMTEAEIRKIVYQYNDTNIEYENRNKVISQVIEENAKQIPDNIAVAFEGKYLTYRQLNEKANQVAHELISKGIGKGDYIGVVMDRSMEVVVSCLGIMKTGAAYSPIDVKWPLDRIKTALQDLQGKVVLINKHTPYTYELEIETFMVDVENLKIPMPNTKIEVSPEDPIYVIFTSGSTGKPKGAINYHKGIMNRLLWMTDFLGAEIAMAALQTSYHVFDASVWQMFWPLINGGKTVIPSPDMEMTAEYISGLLFDEKVTITDFVPSIFNSIVNELEETPELLEKWLGLKSVYYGGEQIITSYVNRFYNMLPHIRNVNLYGPTETSIGCVYYDIEGKENDIPIGKPIKNVKVLITDKYGQIVPEGIPGELCISGICVGGGYLRDEEKTRRVFVETPYKKLGYPKMYKTGDLTRWLSDGNIEYMGRIDQQVKIRGFRIELGEIEGKLLSHPEIKEAVVMAREGMGNGKYLCAYLIAERTFSSTELREYVKKDLPEYMVPAFFVQMEKLPVTNNGKLDKKALPEPDGGFISEALYIAPRNEVEEKLVEVWQQVLGIAKVGIDDNFFELGGDSIKAIQITSRLNKHDLKLQIKELFKNPTIGELSKYVVVLDKKETESLITGEAVLTPIQRWFFEQNFDEMYHWNQSVMLYSKDGFEEIYVRRSFAKIAEHHDMLRGTYINENGIWKQTIRGIDGELFTLDIFDFSGKPEYKKLIQEKEKILQGAVNLNKGPLMKLGLFKTDEGDHLLIVIHHLVVDGISWRIILEDFKEGYKLDKEGKEIVLHAKTASFKEWGEKLEEYGESEKISNAFNYWNEVESFETNSLGNMSETGTNLVSNLEKQSFGLSYDETQNLLKQVGKAYNTEINDIFLCSLAKTIKSWSGDTKVLLEMEGHGREEGIANIDISRTVGWFTTTYPFILDISQAADVGTEIKLVKEALRKVPQKGVDYGVLKYMSQKYGYETDSKLKPQISFNYMGQFDDDIRNEIFSLSDIEVESNRSLKGQRSCSIDINGIVLNGKLKMEISYSKQQYKYKEIERFTDLYKEMLCELIFHCINKHEPEMTPSDFTGKNMSLEEMEDIFDVLEGGF
ncbi:non-ribosomal peptide synthetase [Aminipila sp.]|uniref:non-ribosomal peptide synthetase n=1 Tax=Aminipila sp. TaxID=2060095 RepID=UPI0028A2D44C|nr:non-ribosomal peptide synthetase [Aminipila sp.]